MVIIGCAGCQKWGDELALQMSREKGEMCLISLNRDGGLALIL